MVKAILVDQDKQAAIELIEILDKQKINIKAALWFYYPEKDEWRLILASPMVDRIGPKKTYETIQKALREIKSESSLQLHHISVVSHKDRIIQLLKHSIRTGKKIENIHFSNNIINNEFIEDAYIYRMNLN